MDKRWAEKSATDSDSPDFDSMTTEELRSYSEAASADIDLKSRKPITIATFEC